MAYLSGIKHKLFMREESTYGDLGASDTAATQGWISGFNAYTRPGAKLSVQNSPITTAGMGIPSAIGRGRSSVAGSFSFYLPKADRLNNRGSATQTQGFLLFLKHLYGDVTTFGTNANHTAQNLPHGGTAGQMGWKAHFSKFDTVKDHIGAAIGNYSTSITKQSFSFISYYSDHEVYLYTGVCPTSMTINAADANSLVTADVSFIARSVTKLFYDSTDGDPDSGAFKVYSESYYEPDGAEIAANATVTTQVTTSFFGDNTSDSMIMSDPFAAMNTVLTVTFNADGGGSAIPFATSSNSDFQTTGISINISKPLGHTNEFGDYHNIGNNLNFIARRFPNKQPRPTGNKTIAGSFTMPIFKTSSTTGVNGSGSYIEHFRKNSQGILNEEDISLQIVFTESATSQQDKFTFDFDNIIFSSTDFGNIDIGISTTTVNWSAVPKSSNALYGDDPLATLTYDMN